MLEMGASYFTFTPMRRIWPISSSSTDWGRRNDGMFERIRPPGTASFSKMVTS